MELVFVGKKTKEDNGTRYFRTDYTIGEYTVTVYDTFYSDGTSRHSAEVQEPEGTYLPHIYYRDNWYGQPVSEFEIQTTSYGSLKAAEFKKYLEAQQVGLDVAEALNRVFDEKED